jgi:hypothetical protein
MSEPIKAGDLVMMKRSCCAEMMRHPVFTVSRIENFSEFGPSCKFCGKDMPDAIFAEGGEQYWHTPLAWLKRIPPPSELADEKHEEELTA